jgi:hypothetical protein
MVRLGYSGELSAGGTPSGRNLLVEGRCVALCAVQHNSREARVSIIGVLSPTSSQEVPLWEVSTTAPKDSSRQTPFAEITPCKAASLPERGSSHPRAEGAQLIRVAAQGKTQRSANLLHPRGSEVSHTPAQALLRHRHRVMKIHRTRALHTILFVQPNFGGNASDAGRNRCDRCRGQVTKCAVAGQHYDWPCFAG